MRVSAWSVGLVVGGMDKRQKHGSLAEENKGDSPVSDEVFGRAHTGRTTIETGSAGGREALLEGHRSARRDRGADASEPESLAATTLGHALGGARTGAARHARACGAQAPSVIEATPDYDAEQLGDFLTSLRSEDATTSSGRGLPF